MTPDDPLDRLAAEIGDLARRLADVQTRLLAMRGAEASAAGPAGAGAETGPGVGPAEAGAEAGRGGGPAGVGAGPGQVPPWAPGPMAVPGAAAGWPGTQPQLPWQPPEVTLPPGYPRPAGYPGAAPPGWTVASAPMQPVPPVPSGTRPPGPVDLPAAGSPPYPVPPVRPAPGPRVPGQGLGPQLVAWTGGTVTLLGIVLLLVLAASRGWLQPAGRVIGGALLALALVGVAAWVHRRPGGRTGAVALAATGVAGLYLDVAAATSRYGYLPVLGGLVVAALVAAGGLALADRWRSQPLAAGAVAGAAVLAPVLTNAGSPLLVGLAVVLQLAAAPVVWRRRWTVLAAVAAVWPFGYGLLAVAHAAGRGQHLATTVAVAAVLLAGLGLAVAGGDRLPTAYRGVQTAAAAVPVLAMALVLDRPAGTLTAVLVALLLFVAAAAQELVSREVRVAAMAAGAVAAFEATMIALRGGTQTAVVLGEAIALAVVAIAMRRRGPLLAAGAFGVVGTFLAVLRDAPLRALLVFPSRPYLVRGEPDTAALVTGAGVSLLVLAAAVAMLVAADRLNLLGARPEPAPLWIAGAGVVLYGAASLLVAAAMLVTPTRDGFLAGHVLVTVSWTVAALALLVRGIRQQALRVAGGVLVVAAVVKLVVFDLSQLDGVARVVAFLGAGLVLLAAGTRYARLVAAAQADAQRGDPP